MVSHEATFAAGMERKAHIAQHSTAPMAGAFARRIRAHALVLTHFSNRYSNKRQMRPEKLQDEPEEDQKAVLKWLIGQAQEAFGSHRVWAAEDFFTFEIKSRRTSDQRFDASLLQPFICSQCTLRYLIRPR